MTPNDTDLTGNTEVHPQTEALARMVHAAWRDGMLAQGREVPTKRLRWESLSKQDQALDCCIAEQMALVLATQNLPFLPASYTMATFSLEELRLFAQAGQARGQSLVTVDQQSGVLMLGLGYGMAQLLANAQAQAEELREARARYTRLLLDLMADADITISRAAELTQISVKDFRAWTFEVMQNGGHGDFPFPPRAALTQAQAAEAGDQA